MDGDRILEEFMAAWEAGRSPDPDAYVDRAAEAEQVELSERIRTYLMVAPDPVYDEMAWAAAAADPVAARAAEIPLGDPEPWPALLPRLRARAGMSWADVARGLGVSRPEKAEGYLVAMERGEHDPRRVTSRALEALGRLLGVPAEALGWTGGGPPPALLRAAAPAPAAGGSAAPPPAPDLSALEEIAERVSRPAHDWDDADELFLGGR